MISCTKRCLLVLFFCMVSIQMEGMRRQYTIAPRVTVDRGGEGWAPIMLTNRTRRQEDSIQRIVVLAGPHKTASSSLQQNFLKWINDTTLDDWAWVAPSPENPKFPQKAYYVLVHSWFKCDRKVDANSKPCRQLDASRNKFSEAWADGKNIFIACEGLDFITKNHNMLTDFLDLLPSAAPRESISFVVNFRTPRVKHLISVYHQHISKEKQKKKSTFVEWMCRQDHIRSVDSLWLVKEILHQNLKTYLLDMSSILNENRTLTAAILCDVMHEPCSADGTIPQKTALRHPVKKNIKTGNGTMDAPNGALSAINSAILDYDCLHKDHVTSEMAGEGKLKIISGQKSSLWERCKDNNSKDNSTGFIGNSSFISRRKQHVEFEKQTVQRVKQHLKCKANMI